MYYYISGILAYTDPSFAVIDAGGVGYKLFITGTTLGKLASAAGQKVKLFTYLSVREDAMELYGFYTEEELSCFRLLISVSGVGAKSAVSILSLYSPERFALAVTTGDAKALSKASGIGAKTAARIVLELKDKMKKEIEVTEEVFREDTPVGNDSLSEARSALLLLGYSSAEASGALRGLSPELSVEDAIKAALKKLMKQ